MDKDAMHAQLVRARRDGLLEPLIEVGKESWVDPCYLIAVASRETNIQNILGDGGHGHGVLQIDDRYHGEFLSQHRDWRTNPLPLIAYGAGMLAANIKWAKGFLPADLHGASALKMAASAYNAGRGGALRGHSLHCDSDYFTTGGDYGLDVMNRKSLVQALRREFGF